MKNKRNYRLLSVLPVLLLLGSCLLPAYAENTEAPAGIPLPENIELTEDMPLPPSEGGFSPDGMMGGPGFTTLTEESFQSDDIPEAYMQPSENPGRVEKIFYTAETESVNFFGGTGSGTEESVKAAYVYLPAGYDDSEEPYNILYLLHGSGGSPSDYLDRGETTTFRNILDHLIENGDMEPVIVVAATYFASNGVEQYLPLEFQVNVTSSFPRELVDRLIPAVEAQYRSFAEDVTPEGITASRDHRAIAGFSMGGVAVWYTFLQQMQACRWFLPISEASWDDGEGGTNGILDSDLSAQVLYDAVLNQGFGKEDFMLFVATGSDDVAFEVSTNQMKSLLAYSDLFMTGENTSCSLMLGGMHTLSATYTYLYHIMPALFAGEGA